MLFLFSLLFVSALCAPPKVPEKLPLAQECDPNLCKLPSCRCSSTDIPGNLKPSEIPQLVLLTFDDAVSVQNIDYYRKAFKGRKNPDGCPIGTTYFVSHEYSDYSNVHELWADGHEIALHSITHQSPTTYWQELSVEGQLRKFGDEAEIISTFADIPKQDIQGIRLPFLQLSGNNSFEMLKKVGLKYDCSWPTQQVNPGLWPYTLDYKTHQQCAIGPCPTASLPGVWVVPMVDWKDNSGTPCAMIDSCVDIPKDVNNLTDFLIDNFNRHYNGTRTPMGFFVHAAWFNRNPIHFEAYTKFIDRMQELNDVYLVSIQRALEWVQNPSSSSNIKNSWPKCQTTTPNECKAQRCWLRKGEEERNMMTCAKECPAVYPWLGNPLGKI